MEHGTGALFRERGVRDYRLERVPGVAAALAEPLPESFLVLPFDQIKVWYDQDGWNACTFASEATALSIDNFFDLGQWQTYDWLEAYKALGGTASTGGLVTDDTLRYCRDVGLLQVGTQKRWPIKSYAFAPENAGEWRRTLAAGLVANGAGVVATQLPTVFGWDSGTVISSLYHQMTLVGWDGLKDTDHALFLNPWKSIPRARLTWGYLEGNGFQNNYVYGYQLVDLKEGPQPLPSPPKIEFNAEVTKANSNLVKLTPALGSDVTGLKGRSVHVKEN